MRRLVCLAVAASCTAAAADRSATPQPQTVFVQLGLTDEQRGALDAGRPVAKVLPWGASSELYVFGAVHIDGSPRTYLTLARGVTGLAGSPGYLAIAELSPAATIEDVGALTLDPDDIKGLKSCREGACDVQLPTASIRAFQDTVIWSQSDAPAQANALARGMVLDLVREYRRGGNAALGVYRDKQHPARVAEQFETMVGRSAALAEWLPELREYLLRYPEADLPGSDSFFYWEKVAFGLKPTVRVNHAVIYRRGDPAAEMSAVAIKQLYASHYFHTALDVSICIPDERRTGRSGFYLMTLKGSEQDGLTGPRGAILRKIVVSKTRSSLETALASIKDAVEHAPSTH